MKKILSRLLKLLVSLLFTLVLIEAGLRFFPRLVPLDLLIHFYEQPRAEIASRVGLKTKGETVQLARDDGGPELRIFKPYTTIVWPIEENETFSVVVMDENGFCNPPGNFAAKTTPVNIITLGDSFTWCQGVGPKETWASRLSQLTGRSVYNLGKEGTGPYEYIQLLKKFGLQKSPRIVIMNIYEGNDLRDVARYYYHRLYHDDDEPAEAVTVQSPPPASGWRSILENYSYTYSLATAARDYLQESKAPLVAPTANAAADNRQREENFRYNLVFAQETVEYNPDNTDTDEVVYARQLYKQQLGFEILVSLKQPLQEFVELSRRYEFVPIVVYSPSAYTTYAANVVFEDSSLAEVMPWFSRQQRDFLDQQARELGYVFVDLTPALQAAAQARGPQELLYYRYDLHFTPAGHREVAETLSQTLRELDLLR